MSSKVFEAAKTLLSAAYKSVNALNGKEEVNVKFMFSVDHPSSSCCCVDRSPMLSGRFVNIYFNQLLYLFHVSRESCAYNGWPIS